MNETSRFADQDSPTRRAEPYRPDFAWPAQQASNYEASPQVGGLVSNQSPGGDRPVPPRVPTTLGTFPAVELSAESAGATGDSDDSAEVGATAESEIAEEAGSGSAPQEVSGDQRHGLERTRAAAGEVLEFCLPDLGEGLTDAEFQSWSVEVGDRVELNQIVADVETAKAVVALPSPYTGTVVELLAEPGDTVVVGAPLIRIRSEQTTPAAHRRSAVLVGYGPETGITSRRRQGRRPQSAQTPEISPESTELSEVVRVGVTEHSEFNTGTFPVSPEPEVDSAADEATSPRAEAESRGSITADNAEPTSGTRDSAERCPATPGARLLARELHIDLWDIPGSGPDGAVTVMDVRSAANVPAEMSSGERTDLDVREMVPKTVGAAPSALPREVRTPISGVRKRIAAAMITSGREIPQAATSLTVDMTATMELLDRLRGTKQFSGLSLTPLTVIARSVLAAIVEFPGINSCWDGDSQEIIAKNYVNLGIAVAAERGLLVPNIKEAQTLNLRELCRELNLLVTLCRSGRATPADLIGGTFTISNVGVFGVDSGVPLVNPGESAILCVGALVKRPWVFGDELAIRSVSTLTLSFDHRVIDGELAARFLAAVGDFLADPLTLLAAS